MGERPTASSDPPPGQQTLPLPHAHRPVTTVKTQKGPLKPLNGRQHLTSAHHALPLTATAAAVAQPARSQCRKMAAGRMLEEGRGGGRRRRVRGAHHGGGGLPVAAGGCEVGRGAPPVLGAAAGRRCCCRRLLSPCCYPSGRAEPLRSAAEEKAEELGGGAGAAGAVRVPAGGGGVETGVGTGMGMVAPRPRRC